MGLAKETEKLRDIEGRRESEEQGARKLPARVGAHLCVTWIFELICAYLLSTMCCFWLLLLSLSPILPRSVAGRRPLLKPCSQRSWPKRRARSVVALARRLGSAAQASQIRLSNTAARNVVARAQLLGLLIRFITACRARAAWCGRRRAGPGWTTRPSSTCTPRSPSHNT